MIRARPSQVSPLPFLRAIQQRVRDRFRATRLFRWLTDRESVTWVSVIQPTTAALLSGPPPLSDYRGLRALLDIEDAVLREWHLIWTTEWAADLNEARFAAAFGNGPPTRRAIRAVEIPKTAWWLRPRPWTALAAGLAVLAAAVANFGTLKDVVVEIAHRPDVSLESTETLHAASNVADGQDIALRGDPFFRSRISGLSMTIVPDPDHPGTRPLPNDGKTLVAGTNRSLDISEKILLRLPFDRLPAGRYLVHLDGRVDTAGSSSKFSPRPGLVLDVRSPVSLEVKAVTPWPPDNQRVTSSEALVDVALRFGRVPEASSTVRVVLPGHWSGWNVESLPHSSTLERQSQNSKSNAKSIVFALRNFPTKSFTSQSLRITVEAPAALTETEWAHSFAGQYAELAQE